MGTPLYMSPEQIRSAKSVDARTDVWSLSVILYELLAGVPPFVGSAVAVGVAIVADPPPPLRTKRPDLDEGLEAVIAKGLEKDPANRFQDVEKSPGILSRWWFWTGVGVIVTAGVITTVALLTERSPDTGDGFTPDQVRAPLVKW